MIGAPRNAKALRQAATEALALEYKKMDAVFKRLDGLAADNKKTHPDFYNGYLAARKIVDNRGRAKKKGGAHFRRDNNMITRVLMNAQPPD